MNPRERTEQFERQFLSPRAAFSADSKGRAMPEEQCELRTDYQRDRDRIVHCKSFRRLKHKTQVFLSPEGDHFRTRLTHTLEVSQIARTIAFSLALNENLTEAIALGHDLGHTPFGHAGERALQEICGFTHAQQSLRTVDCIEKACKGLNLTFEVRNGIVHHTSGEEAETLEGRIVRIADQIAFINHDIDDAIRAHVLSEKDLPRDVTEALGKSKSERIDTLVKSVVASSAESDTIRMDDETQKYFEKLYDFMFERVYLNPFVKGEEKKVPGLIHALYETLLKTEKIPFDFLPVAERDGMQRAVIDYIAGMTDHYAVSLYEELFIPKGWDQ